MKKYARKFMLKKTFLGSVLVSSVAGAVVSTIALSIDQTTSRDIVYNGVKFQSYDSLLAHLIDSKQIDIQNEKVLGDISSSYSNSVIGQLNKVLLPTYDPTKIEFAWLNSLGQTVRSYESAKETYFNPGLVLTKWTDGYGNVFSSLKDAEKSRERNFLFTLLKLNQG